MSSPEKFTREKFPDGPVEIVSGESTLEQVPELLQELGISRALVVCGQNVGRLPQVTELVEVNPDLFVGLFDQVEPDPSDSTIIAGGARAAKLGAEAVLAIGGGSSLDAGKAIAAEAVSPGWIATCDCPGQPTEVPQGVLPIIAVPTTAGTGSEVTPFSVITFTETRRKLVLNHPRLYPRIAVLDPDLLASAPRQARVAAGMDALTHAVESYLSKQATEQTQSRALEAVIAVARHLRGAAAEDPSRDDLSALQRAAMIAGLAFSRTRLGIVHAMALPLSALFGVPHGVANAILLPYGMAYNLPAAPEAYANLAAALGVKVSGTEADLGEEAVQAVRDLAREIGAPQRMREVGVERSAIPRMAEEAIKSAHLAVNPRPVELSDLIAVYEEAL